MFKRLQQPKNKKVERASLQFDAFKFKMLAIFIDDKLIIGFDPSPE